MRLWVLLALWFIVCLSLILAQKQQVSLARGKRRRGEQRRGKKVISSQLARQGGVPVLNDAGTTIFLKSYKSVNEQESNYNIIPGRSGQCQYMGITMFDKAVWSPKPCVTCLCSEGSVVCDEVACPILRCQLPYTPTGECCPVCKDHVLDVPDFSGDSPVSNDPSEPDLWLQRTPAEIEEILRQEEEEHREEEERLRRKDEEKRKNKKKKDREAAERKARDELRKAEEERWLREEAEAAEERRRRQEEQRKHEEERMKTMETEQRLMLKALEEAAERAAERASERQTDQEEEENEEIEWLRGDVFQMPPLEPTAVGLPPLPPLSEPVEPTDEEENDDADSEEVVIQSTQSLPKGCTISDVTVNCDNAKLSSIPPLSIPELKSLSLEGNDITAIPAGAFNGIPNLEWINFGKNKITSQNIDPQAFKGLKLLSRLYMDGNLLEKIPTALPSTLQELKINENNLCEINENSFAELHNLITLEMEGNVLSESNVDPQAFITLTGLSYLRLGRNHFRTIPQGLPPSLLELYLENNVIEEISEGAFNQTYNLNVVVLRHNKIDESRIAPLAWINHKTLESIDLSYNNLYLVPSFLPKSLLHLVLVGNKIERIPGYVFAHMDQGLEYLYLSYNKLDGEGIEPESFIGCLQSMTELCLDHNQITSVPNGINEMTSLHFLRLNNNQIRNIAEDSICDPINEEDSQLVALRLENNYLDLRKIPPTTFSCVRSYSSVVLRPQKIK
ncbi:extracellular matrix protein 2 isoform X1 [Alosa sapidissima]|uniref:extracellular matrix protein 2 isoform X1 n=1 Tax=Alosa sapidissima TaxID=34773 RepID=UPI001C099532|nr:extracellular matrix protein 2 isoform X1 [Alosa sapidissima]XP_041945206.1 extracellular matrix protein 2 isoform X1 [Alosa sapidissima]